MAYSAPGEDPMPVQDFIDDNKVESSKREADIGNEPPKDTIPEQVELDVTNKFQEIEKERELSTSEKSDLTLLEENLMQKGLEFEV